MVAQKDMDLSLIRPAAAGASKSYNEEMVEAILNEFGIPKRRGYRVLRSIILHMYNDPSLSIRGAQRKVAEESGLLPHNIRYAMDSAVRGASITEQTELLAKTEDGHVSTRDFVEYCICRLPGSR